MKTSGDLPSCRYHLAEGDKEDITLDFQGRMDASNAAALLKTLPDLVKEKRFRSLTIDLGTVTYLDDYGVLVLLELKSIAAGKGGNFYLENVSDRVQEMLSVFNFESLGESVPFTKKASPGVFVRLGDATIRHVSDLEHFISFIGSVCLSLLHTCFHPKSLRTEDTFLCMQKTGVDALPIVGLISFLMGLIMAFMSSVQLKQFGANIYVASLVSLAMTRELGPIMTGIIVAGRSSSAFAAEIGSMKISEEIDALFTMGFNPTSFLVVPKIIASLIVVPLLTLFSDLFAIMGGLVVGVFMLDLTANSYITQTFRTLTLFDVFLGFLKSGVFALLISWIGCLRGFQVRGGAAAVGKATTSAVVSSIFLIVVTDAVFAVILRYWE